MIENQVTSIEQANRLILLGIPAEKASMAWTTVNGYKTVVERDLCLPENIEGYAFTVADLLEILPEYIKFDGVKCHFLVSKISKSKALVWLMSDFMTRYIRHNDLRLKVDCYPIILSDSVVDGLCDAIVWVYSGIDRKSNKEKSIDNETFILSYLYGRDYTSPTEIGRAHAEMFGIKSLNHHSSWASPICKRMVKKGLLIRNDKGHYKLNKK